MRDELVNKFALDIGDVIDMWAAKPGDDCITRAEMVGALHTVAPRLPSHVYTNKFASDIGKVVGAWVKKPIAGRITTIQMAGVLYMCAHRLIHNGIVQDEEDDDDSESWKKG